MSADLSSGGLWDVAAGLKWWWRPALARVRVVRWRGQVESLAGLRIHLAPTRGLSVREGDPLQIDGCFHSLKQDVPLFCVELEASLARITPPPRLEGEGGLGRGTESGLKQTSVCRPDSSCHDRRLKTPFRKTLTIQNNMCLCRRHYGLSCWV